MGASESKLVFKQGIFKLQEAQAIAADDTYWTGFWQLPESAEDVFTLFSANDIRRTRDASLGNLETLILAVTSRLFVLRRHASFPHAENAPEKEALNCIRILTRILPYIYEADNLESWEERFFWASRRTRLHKKRQGASDVLFDEAQSEDGKQQDQAEEPEFEEAKPLAEELIDTLVDLLFYSDFTLPANAKTKAKVTYSIWSSGVGCNTPVVTNARLECNRTEVMRLLLTLSSKSMYMSASTLPVKGVRVITYLATSPDKQIVLSMLCSFMNTALKFNPASWKIPYDHVVLGDPKHSYIASCIQCLLVLILYPIPEDESAPQRKNFFRHFLGRLHRAEDFQFICDGISRTLHQPLNATSSYLPGSQKPVRWASEMIMLFWEVVQCNKRFRAFVVDTERGHDFLVLILFYAIEFRSDPAKQGIVRMCVFVLQTLSVEGSFGAGLNKQFSKQETLPASIRIDDWSGTYGDFLIVSLHTLITGSKGKLDTVYPALLAVINNVAPHLEQINRLSCLKMLQLYVRVSAPNFLLANNTNHELLVSLLESMNAIIENKYDENPEFIANIIKHRKRFEALRNFTLESAQEEVERLNQQRKEAAAAGHNRSDQSPAQQSRRDSVDSVHTPTTPRTPHLPEVPESGTFTIGEDDEDEDDDDSSSAHRATPQSSRAESVDELAEEAVPTQLRGMSEKARGKMPANAPTFPRVNSMSSVTSAHSFASPSGSFQPSPQWIDSWLPTLPLHTILTLISFASPTHPASSTLQAPPSLPPAIEPRPPPRVHLFEWSPLSMGWYESLLWSFICASEMIVERGTVGVWNGTAIRLFRVEKGADRGPSLMKPLGAVDALGSGIVQRIGSLQLRGAPSPQAQVQGNEANGQAQGQGAWGDMMR